MNKNSLSHITIGLKIFLAMRLAMKSRSCHHVMNRKGRACLAVRYLTGEQAWRVLGKSSGFWFLDKTGRDITATVLESLKA